MANCKQLRQSDDGWCYHRSHGLWPCPDNDLDNSRVDDYDEPEQYECCCCTETVAEAHAKTTGKDAPRSVRDG